MLEFARHKFALLACCQMGAGAMSFAAAIPALMGTVGIASDLAIATMKKSQLQALADQAAIAAANELAIGNDSTSVVSATVSSYVDANASASSRNILKSPVVSSDKSSVTVTLTESWVPFFAHFIGLDVTPISTSATARLMGESKICVLALEGKSVGAVAMSNSATIQANGCSVYSNSISSTGIFLSDNSTIEADLVCSAGGVSGYGVNSADKVQKDCPVIADPLASRPTPSVGACNNNNLAITTGSVELKPGVYCGGLRVSGDAKVTFAPGEYVIKDGSFLVRDRASVTGHNVAFYLTGKLSLIGFLGDATVDLSGAEKGAMAGLLFYEDPASSSLRLHAISAANAHTLTGTIYLPKGTLIVDPNSTVAQSSAYTAIVARRVVVAKGPKLVLNANYSATKVPVPAGIKSAASVVLSE